MADTGPPAIVAGFSTLTCHCPLCNGEIAHRKPKHLNGIAICKRCWRKFIGRREAAYLLDCLLFYGMMWAFWAGIVWPWAMATPPSSTTLVLQVLVYIGSLVLFACKDGFAGFSPGKWLAGVQVLDVKTRTPAGFWASFKRNLPLVIPYLSILAALVIVLQLGRGRRWGDGWAKTMVVWREHASKPPFNPDGFVCYECGYDLRGNVSGICPECGRPIPEDRRPLNAEEAADALAGVADGEASDVGSVF